MSKESERGVSVILLILGCILATIVLVALVVGIIVIINSGERDVVSNARQGWINRRSEQDEDQESK